MSDITATSPEPAYLARLALHRLPFSAVSDAAGFYDGRHIKQRRLLLLHIIRATQIPILIHADAGMGKTTMLQHLQRETARDLRFCTIAAATPIQQLASHVSACFGVELTGLNSEKEIEQALKQRLLQLRNRNIVPVLLLDDAEKLPRNVLLQIQAWLAWQHEDKSLLQAVMTSQSDSLMAVFTLQKVDLPVFETDDIAAYLLQRLEAAGFNGDFPFKDKDIGRLAKLSQGNPGKLNKLAHQQLLDVNKKNTIFTDFAIATAKLGRWSALFLVGLVLVVLLTYQDEINGWMTTDRQNESDIELPEFVADNEITTVIVEKDNKIKPALNGERAERETLAELLADMPVVIENSEPEPEPEKLANEVPALKETDVDAPEMTTTITESNQSLPAENEAHTSGWINSQNPTDYTFQLMGSWSYDEVTQFIQKNALTGDVARFTSLRNNKPWHVVIYGVYASKKAALSANNDWPAPLNTLPTWLRRFDSVQNQIKDKGVSR